MKISLCSFLVILIWISSCTSQSNKNFKKFTLQGEITGQDSGIIIIKYAPDTTLICDTAKIKNGKFGFTGKIFEPTRADLFGGNNLNTVVVYLEPQKMKISLTRDKFKECKMIGSKTQNDFDLLNKMQGSFYERLSLVREQMWNIDDSIKNSKNDSAQKLLMKKAEEIDKQRSLTRKKIDSIQIKFILENPKSFLTPIYLLVLENNEVISLDSAKSIFNGMDNSLKKSRYGKYIIEDIRKKENVRTGVQAADFTALDLNQQTVKLSQFKGKNVILLDFWASWCVPCRESIPHLKTIYKRYNPKGFEVISISQDENKKAWMDAIKHDSTGIWIHILAAEKRPGKPSQMFNDDVSKNYFVQSIPTQILIDKNGKIIYRHVGYSKKSEELLDKQISQIFDN
jgi:peroxiredoxin